MDSLDSPTSAVPANLLVTSMADWSHWETKSGNPVPTGALTDWATRAGPKDD